MVSTKDHGPITVVKTLFSSVFFFYFKEYCETRERKKVIFRNIMDSVSSFIRRRSDIEEQVL